MILNAQAIFFAFFSEQEIPDELHDMAERFRKFLERREAEHRPYRGRDRYRN